MKRLPVLLPLLALLTACNGKPSAPAAAAPAPGGAVTAVLAAVPAGTPGDIHRVRASARPGDEVTLRGRIMGADEPFVAGRAAFVLGDPSVLTPCNAKPGDGCPSPWDVCCDTAEDKRRGTATIQITDAAGAVLREPLEGVAGLDKLASLTVQGKVAAVSTADTLVVNATAIRVEPPAGP